MVDAIFMFNDDDDDAWKWMQMLMLMRGSWFNGTCVCVTSTNQSSGCCWSHSICKHKQHAREVDARNGRGCQTETRRKLTKEPTNNSVRAVALWLSAVRVGQTPQLTRRQTAVMMVGTVGGGGGNRGEASERKVSK